MGENVESGEVMTNVLEVLDSIENKDSITFQAVHAKSIVCQARIKHSGGVLKEAEELYKKGLEMQINILGNESDEVSITLSHLATVQQVSVYHLAEIESKDTFNAVPPNVIVLSLRTPQCRISE